MHSWIAFVAASVLLSASFVSAQEDPYTNNFARPRCYASPYPPSGIECATLPLLESHGSRAVIGETTLGAPGQERGWLTLVNPDSVPQRVLVLYRASWRAGEYWQEFTVPALGEVSVDFLADPFFVEFGGLRLFRTVLYAERAIYAKTTTRPAEDMWSRATHEVGVTIPRVQ